MRVSHAQSHISCSIIERLYTPYASFVENMAVRKWTTSAHRDKVSLSVDKINGRPKVNDPY